MIARYSSSLATASLITIGLLYLMQQMIATGRTVLDGRKAYVFDDWIVVERKPQPIVEKDRVERPEEPDPTPPREIVDGGFDGPPTVVAVAPTAPAVDRLGPAASSLIDGDLMPIVKVQPNYPIWALQRELEGQVLVEFTVTRTGSVSDVVVVESTHHVFERPAIEAASKFRYRPRVIDGDPVAVSGVRNLVTFRLND